VETELECSGSVGDVEVGSPATTPASSAPDYGKPAICGIVRSKANLDGPSKEDFDTMARRRFQNPKPRKEGNWWVLYYRADEFENGRRRRKKKRQPLAPATMPYREVQKISSDFLRPMNQGLQVIGSATNFRAFVEGTYKEVVLPTFAKSTKDRYRGVIDNYLLPQFGDLCLRDVSSLTVDRFFTGLGDTKLDHESVDKIRDVLSSVLGSAIRYGLLVKNPVEGVRLPRPKKGRKEKPWITQTDFGKLLMLIAEPYATMIFVAIYTGLRVSELIGLRWDDIHYDSITVDERFCRGDWGAPKSQASNATIPVNRAVIERIERLKSMTVDVKAGRATRHYKVVKLDGPNDLVFQSVQKGAAMRDNNILVRHIKPAARKLKLDFVNWRCLRTSYATWLKVNKADPKDAQALMRHSRVQTTLEIYQQNIPESQRMVVDGLVN
jgi:integrase